MEPALALVRKKTKEGGLTSTTIQPENWCWEEFEFRNDSSTLVGRMKVSAKPASRRKALKRKGSTTAQNGTRSNGRSQRLSESGSQKSKLHPLSESQWNMGTLQDAKTGVGKAQQLGHTIRRFQRSRCHGRLSSGYSWKVGGMWLVSGAIRF